MSSMNKRSTIIINSKKGKTYVKNKCIVIGLNFVFLESILYIIYCNLVYNKILIYKS